MGEFGKVKSKASTLFLVSKSVTALMYSYSETVIKALTEKYLFTVVLVCVYLYLLGFYSECDTRNECLHLFETLKILF